ncbi:MAG: DNA replication/repair protein RecF [Chloroflexota bacterium]
MQIETLTLNNLRNHVDTSLELSPGLNLFYGENGAGKTTVLEAISICSISRSFMPTSDAALIRAGQDFYFCSAQCRNRLDMPYKVSVNYVTGRKKAIKSSYGDNLNPKDIIGELPVVALNPDYKSITFGTPADRRHFLDGLLSQSSRRYMESLITLKKSLKQRNNLLADARKLPYFDHTLLDSWTDMFIESAADVMARRVEFTREFSAVFERSYRDTFRGKEAVEVRYAPETATVREEELTKDNIREALSERSQRLKHAELKRGSTLFGPQKDELTFLINGALAKDAASQGQHKSLLISLKFAEFIYLQNARGETPVFLLDDIFSELDDERTARVIDLVLEHRAQSFITATDSFRIKAALYPKSSSRTFKVSAGAVIKD